MHQAFSTTVYTTHAQTLSIPFMSERPIKNKFTGIYKHQAERWMFITMLLRLDQELISYRYSSSCCFCSSCWGELFKKTKASSFQMEPGWNLAGMFFTYIHIDWRSRIFDLMSHFQNGDHDVISRRKVLPPGEWRWRVCHAPMQQRMQVPDPWYILTCFWNYFTIFDYLCKCTEVQRRVMVEGSLWSVLQRRLLHRPQRT